MPASSGTPWRSPTSISTSCRACSAGAWCAPGPGSSACAGAICSEARSDSRDVRAAVRDAHRAAHRAPRRRRPGARPHPSAHARHLLQPGVLLLRVRRATADWTPSSPRSPTRPGASGTPTSCAPTRRHASGVLRGATRRRCTSRRFRRWRAPPLGREHTGADAERAHREPTARRRRRRLRRDAQPAPPSRSPRAPCARSSPGIPPVPCACWR